MFLLWLTRSHSKYVICAITNNKQDVCPPPNLQKAAMRAAMAVSSEQLRRQSQEYWGPFIVATVEMGLQNNTERRLASPPPRERGAGLAFSAAQ